MDIMTVEMFNSRWYWKNEIAGTEDFKKKLIDELYPKWRKWNKVTIAPIPYPENVIYGDRFRKFYNAYLKGEVKDKHNTINWGRSDSSVGDAEMDAKEKSQERIVDNDMNSFAGGLAGSILGDDRARAWSRAMWRG